MRQMFLAAGLLAGATLYGADVAVALDPAITIQLAEIKQARSVDLNGKPAALFGSLKLPQLLAVRDNLLADTPSPRREKLLVQLMFYWGRLEGPAAFAYAREQQAMLRSEAIAASLSGWAVNEPDRAWETVMVHSNRGAVMPVLTVIGEQDLAHALRLYQDLLPDKACLECAALHLIVAASRTGEFDAVLTTARALPPGPLRDALWGQYWAYLGDYLPEWGLRDLAGITDAGDRKTALTEFCKGWGQKHFDDCLEYILKQVDSSLRDDLLLTVVQDWSHDAGHDEVVAVLKTLPADLNDRALLGLASTLANLDARAVVDWVRPRPYSETRTNALDNAMRRWATLEPEAAHAYLAAVEDRETRGILLWSYLRARVKNGTFLLAELAEVDAGYSADWRVRLLSTIATDLANPAINSGGRYDLKEFIRVVNERTDLSAEQKQKILTPFAARK
jgi:hypothetical protein